MSHESGLVKGTFSLANLCRRQGKLKEAEKLFFIAQSQGHAKAAFNLSTMLAKEGQVKMAEEYLLIAHRQGRAEATENLCAIYVQTGRQGKADELVPASQRKMTEIPNERVTIHGLQSTAGQASIERVSRCIANL